MTVTAVDDMLLDPATSIQPLDFIGCTFDKITLRPAGFLSFPAELPRDWSVVKFGEDSIPLLTNSSAVYAFVVRCNVYSLETRLVVYIGKATRVKERYRSYVKETYSKDARPLVQGFIRTWGAVLEFHYTHIPKDEIAGVEEVLHDIFTPWGNDVFTGQIGKAYKAFRKGGGTVGALV